MIEVSTTVNAPLSKVWSSWTDASHIIHWNFASDDWTCPRATNPLKIGATFNWRMEAKDQSMGFDFKGTYTDIQEEALIVYELEDGRRVEISFTEEVEGKVLIKESFEAEGSHSDELQSQGWQAILGNFKKYVESLS